METARKHGDHNLLRDVAIYRDMWHIDDLDQPIGQKAAWTGPAGRNSTGATSTHASPDKEAASSTPANLKANRNRPENPTPRVETPNPAAAEERNPQWKTRQEPSSNNSPDGPTQ